MSKYGDEAHAAFMRGCNCSQAAVVPFASLMGMTEEQALRLAGGFGGGVGRMREVCGAFPAS